MAETTVLSSLEISKVLTRIAHDIVEKYRRTNDTILIGLLTHSVLLAHHPSLLINDIKELFFQAESLNFRSYLDDIDHCTNPPVKELKNYLTSNITGKIVVLVNNVFPTSSSIWASMDSLVRHGRPKCTQLAVPVDGGHRKIPIRDDYVKNIPKSRKERIQAKLTEIDNSDFVICMTRSES